MKMTYEKWEKNWGGETDRSFHAIGYTDGTSIVLWRDGDTLFPDCAWEKLHPLVVEDLRGVAREQRNSRILLEAL